MGKNWQKTSGIFGLAHSLSFPEGTTGSVNIDKKYLKFKVNS